jgi:hypothetical protein
MHFFLFFGSSFSGKISRLIFFVERLTLLILGTNFRLESVLINCFALVSEHRLTRQSIDLERFEVTEKALQLLWVI